MVDLSRKEKSVSYFFQVIAAFILLKATYAKFSDYETSVKIFQTLGIEETRLIIATIEGMAAFLLMSKNIPQYGAVLGFATMLGAAIAHITVLGFVVNNDGGELLLLMLVVIISTSIVMWIWRRKLPLVGHTFE